MKKIIQGIQTFQKDIFPNNRDLFQRLAAGQNPDVLFICCSDSRISLDLIMQAGPGDLFVCRNAGNIVPVYGLGDAVSGTIEYAVAVLKINHIVICGHSDCSAMKGLLKPESLGALPAVKEWLRHAEAARCALDTEEAESIGSSALTAVTKMNVRLQLAHLGTHAKVFARTKEGSLHLHGWFYQIKTGEVQTWDPAAEEWLPFDKSPFISKLQPEVVPQAQHA